MRNYHQVPIRPVTYEPHEIRRREIEEAFSKAENEPQSFERFGIKTGSCHFRDSCEVLPLQTADMFAWTMYRGILDREKINSANEIATRTLQDLSIIETEYSWQGEIQIEKC